MSKYSLANHILSIKPNDQQLNLLFGTINIGGEGSYLDSVNISLESGMWSTTGYATGGWVHNKRLNRNGTVSLSLNQLSNSVAILKRLASIFYTGDYDGFTITLTTNDGTLISTCTDCYLSSIPEQAFAAEAANQTWSFTCGKIVFD